jgi:hypothetical protein
MEVDERVSTCGEDRGNSAKESATCEEAWRVNGWNYSAVARILDTFPLKALAAKVLVMLGCG